MSKLSNALALAVQAHEGQVRKSTTIPYISHPLAVSAIALEFGASENQAIAALLHDAIEDGGNKYANIIKAQFGDHVHDLVQGCTDGTPDHSGQKAPWIERTNSTTPEPSCPTLSTKDHQFSKDSAAPQSKPSGTTANWQPSSTTVKPHRPKPWNLQSPRWKPSLKAPGNLIGVRSTLILSI